VKAFAAVYGQQTSNAVTLRGRIFKRGYTKTRRQTILAKMCAPPRRRPLWPSFLFSILTVVLVWANAHFELASILEPIITVLILMAAINLVWASLYNIRRYPVLLDQWGRSYYCFTCGARGVRR
jgi:hypothetical protein